MSHWPWPLMLNKLRPPAIIINIIVCGIWNLYLQAFSSYQSVKVNLNSDEFCSVSFYCFFPFCFLYLLSCLFEWPESCALYCKPFCMTMDNNIRRLLDSLVVECWLQVREVPGSIACQGPRHTKDVIKMVPVVPLLGTQH